MPRINKTFYPRGKSEKSKPGIFPPDAKQQTVARCSLTNKQSAAAVRNSIVKKARAKAQGKRLYIRGVINQDPSTEASPVELFEQANKEEADFDVLLPAEIDEATGFFAREMRKLPKTYAMVHSKVVLIDPFSAHPILLTGSHNLGPKASSKNDENMLIIRDAPGLAAAYAVNIMAIYNQYRWRFRRHAQPKNKRWRGLKDNDTWQRGYLKPGSEAWREINFWAGLEP